MKLLLKRDQDKWVFGRPTFKLWCKMEFEGDELLLVARYQFKNAILVRIDQPGLFRNSVGIGFFCFFLGLFIASTFTHSYVTAYSFSAVVAAAGGWFFYDRMRETIYVRDLMEGRNFRCWSIVDLARREHYLSHVSSYFRQVLETAKHWGGVEQVPVPPLSPGEAKLAVIRGI